ncbi:hypothetical protein YPPY89_2664, partial [Yersinia pestis PY-89]
MKRPYP